MTRAEFQALLLRKLEEAAQQADVRHGRKIPRDFGIVLGAPNTTGRHVSITDALAELYISESSFYRCIDLALTEVASGKAWFWAQKSGHEPGPFESTWNAPPGSGPFKIAEFEHVSFEGEPETLPYSSARKRMSLKAVLAGTAATIALQLLVGVELMILLGTPEFSPTATEQELDAEIVAYMLEPKALMLVVPLCILASVMGTLLTVRIAKARYVLHALIVAVAAIFLGYLMDDTPIPLWYETLTNGTSVIAALATALVVKRMDARK
jgi:hypothetical protein